MSHISRQKHFDDVYDVIRGNEEEQTKNNATDPRNVFICHFVLRLGQLVVVVTEDYHLLIYAVCFDNEMNKRIHLCIL